MSERFEGVEAGKFYTGRGDLANSCQAVNFATLFGLNDFELVHNDLRDQELTDDTGITTLPSEGGEVDLVFGKVTLGAQEMYFDLEPALVAAQEAFSTNKAIQFTTVIPGSDGEPVMHPILFIGHNKDDEKVTKVFVGDSRTDGVSEITPEFAMTILEAAAEDVGVIVGQTLEPSIEVEQAHDGMGHETLEDLLYYQDLHLLLLSQLGAPVGVIEPVLAAKSLTAELLKNKS